MRDAGLSAFSTFFMQSPSFLHQQRSMEKKRGINGTSSLSVSPARIRPSMSTLTAYLR